MTNMSIAAGNATKLFRLAMLMASMLLAAVILAGCSSGGDMGAVDAAAPVSEADGGTDEDAGGSDSSDPSSQNRSIIITGSMYMTVEKPLEAADKATTIVKDAGGRIDARNETAPDEWTGGSAELTLRIPTNRLEAVIEDLRELGTVDELTTTASDVTNQVTDLDARISTLRASTERIEALLVEAKDISDIIKLEDELASRQAELESLEAEQRGLNDQVSLSTIALTLTTVPVVIVDDSPSTFMDGLATGWNGLTSFVSLALVVLGVLLPWLIALGAIALVIVVAVRMGASRSARRAAVPIDENQPAPAVPAPETTNAP
jgi:hypothetical protein